MAADAHPVEAQDQHLVAEPDVVAVLHAPWHGDVHPAADHHSGADLGPEKRKTATLTGNGIGNQGAKNNDRLSHHRASFQQDAPR